ncbi:MAG: TRAP transporter small permease subunit [Betaproteobacteria bacterium]
MLAALETLNLALILALAVIVVFAVVMRALGASPGWYDEIASNLLAWITWFGAAYAALRGSHMTVQGVLVKLPPGPRMALFFVAEAIVLATMALVVVAGWKIVQTLSGESLVSLAWLPRAAVQSALPVGAALFILARLLALPEAMRQVRAGTDADAMEIATAIERAEEMHGAARGAGPGP